MATPYKNKKDKERAELAAIAAQLKAARPIPSRLAPLILMTDPDRVSDPLRTDRNLPIGSAIIYRHFGAPDARKTADTLRQVTFERGQQLLIGADPHLAMACGADGVHFRRDAALTEPRLWRRRCPDWIITMAGLKGAQTYQSDLSVLDGLFVSAIFPSRSPSAGDPIGVVMLRQISHKLPVNVIALGGVNAHTAPELIGTGAGGFAAIDGLT